MQQRRRELILNIIDGCPELPPIMFHFNKLRQCDVCLLWLLKNKFTGKNLVALFKSKNNSITGLIGFVLKRVFPTRPNEKVYYDYDYVR